MKNSNIKVAEPDSSAAFSILNRLNKEEILWIQLQYKVFEKKIVECFKLFRTNGVEPILIKGWAAAQFYPESWQRIFTDIDICVDPKKFELAEKIFRSEEAQQLNLDLHRGFRRLDTLDWSDLFAKSDLIDLDGTGIRVLCPEDHLRILCVHWLRDGGGYREKLWDVFYMLENRPGDFDWNRCLDIVDKKRNRWIVCTIALAHRYLGLSLEGTPLEEDTEKIPVWLIKALESEWKSQVRLEPLAFKGADKKKWFQQVLKRIPPNKIQATVELEGDFDRYPRILYQILNIFQRFYNSSEKIIKVKFNKVRK